MRMQTVVALLVGALLGSVVTAQLARADSEVTAALCPSALEEIDVKNAEQDDRIDEVLDQADQVRFFVERHFRANGDLVLADPGEGIVLRTADGSECHRVFVDALGAVATEPASCP